MTDELKKAFVSADTDEEKKAVAESFNEEVECLNDEELNNVAGGLHIRNRYIKAE